MKVVFFIYIYFFFERKRERERKRELAAQELLAVEDLKGEKNFLIPPLPIFVPSFAFLFFFLFF